MCGVQPQNNLNRFAEMGIEDRVMGNKVREADLVPSHCNDCMCIAGFELLLPCPANRRLHLPYDTCYSHPDVLNEGL